MQHARRQRVKTVKINLMFKHCISKNMNYLGKAVSDSFHGKSGVM